MSPDGSVDVAGVWKRFKADRRRQLLRDQIRSPFSRQRGWSWALRDVGFSFEPGESVGLIGLNGSGKTTLLKVLCRVMYPYAGTVEIKGRVGALIEVRAGIHPELTGRENVSFYGSVLGLRRREIALRFDDIVSFAELEHAIDRQVKFYSLGMQMRLGFSVAAFMSPHVMLVDEVLSVGDASFQHRCLDRMRQMLSEGTTLVLVSHDLAAVESTCERAIWLRQGEIAADEKTSIVLPRYKEAIEESAEWLGSGDSVVRLLKAEVHPPPGESMVTTNGDVSLSFSLRSEREATGLAYIGLSEGTASPVFVARREVVVPRGDSKVACVLEDLPLGGGRYFVWFGVMGRGVTNTLLPWHPTGPVDIFGPSPDPAPVGVVRMAPVHVRAQWTQSHD